MPPSFGTLTNFHQLQHGKNGRCQRTNAHMYKNGVPKFCAEKDIKKDILYSCDQLWLKCFYASINPRYPHIKAKRDLLSLTRQIAVK